MKDSVIEIVHSLFGWLSVFFLDLTNTGMIFEAFGVFLVAKYGIPRNNDVSTKDTVVVSKKGKELNKALLLLKKYTRRERFGFVLIGVGIVLMLVDRNV